MMPGSSVCSHRKPPSPNGIPMYNWWQAQHVPLGTNCGPGAAQTRRMCEVSQGLRACAGPGDSHLSVTRSGSRYRPESVEMWRLHFSYQHLRQNRWPQRVKQPLCTSDSSNHWVSRPAVRKSGLAHSVPVAFPSQVTFPALLSIELLAFSFISSAQIYHGRHSGPQGLWASYRPQELCYLNTLKEHCYSFTGQPL